MMISFDTEKIIMRPQDISKILQAWLKTLDMVDKEKEHFIVIHLNVRSHIKQIEIVGIGTINATLVHPREVYKRAILESSVNIIIAHNHPSGECSPSEEDIAVTKRLIEVGNIIGIKLMDHIVFSDCDHYSFADNGMLD